MTEGKEEKKGIQKERMKDKQKEISDLTKCRAVTPENKRGKV